MDRQYLEAFNNQQLQHYLKTLKRRVSDLRELTLQLGRDNQQLGGQYEALTKQKFQLHNAIQQKKKGWGKWINKGKQKLTYIFHIGKKQQKPTEEKEQQVSTLPQQIANQQLQPHQQAVQGQSNKNSPPKKITLQNFNFDDLYQIGKQKITGLFKRNKEGYNPHDKDEYQVQYANRQQNLKENVLLIRQITGEHSQPLPLKEESIQERQLKRKLLVEAEIAKKSNSSLHTYSKQHQTSVVKEEVKAQKMRASSEKLQENKIQKVAVQHKQSLNELKQSNKDLQPLEAQEEDNQVGARFHGQMDNYVLQQQNLSQIIEKQTQNPQLTQQQIEEHLVDKTSKKQQNS